MRQNSSIYIIIPAGGSGSRYGNPVKKQFLELNGETLLTKTCNVFLSLSQIKQIVVSLPEEDLRHESLLKDDRIQYVMGGQTRSDSVHRGYLALKDCQDTDLVLVHDAARPCLTPALIERVIKATLEYGAAIPAIAVSDTVKEVSENDFVTKTIQRNQLRSVQTPQGFLYGKLAMAYQKLDTTNAIFTDEAMLMEALGEKVKLVDGERENIKITTPFDKSLAEVLLNKP